MLEKGRRVDGTPFATTTGGEAQNALADLRAKFDKAYREERDYKEDGEEKAEPLDADEYQDLEPSFEDLEINMETNEYAPSIYPIHKTNIEASLTPRIQLPGRTNLLSHRKRALRLFRRLDKTIRQRRRHHRRIALQRPRSHPQRRRQAAEDLRSHLAAMGRLEYARERQEPQSCHLQACPQQEFRRDDADGTKEDRRRPLSAGYIQKGRDGPSEG